ncbi:hypothetical protein [Vulcanisaeta souniana]|nr:hypothetical protein [Vulcanisaeta souniana]
MACLRAPRASSMHTYGGSKVDTETITSGLGRAWGDPEHCY